MEYCIRQMTIDDYNEVYRLWEQTEGLCLEEGDDRKAIEIYLNRNPGLCFLACVDKEIVGTVLCGHDGRRGTLRHLVIKHEYRGQGIAKALVARCLSGLVKSGITRCNTFVMNTNIEGRHFWEHLGWYFLEDDYKTLQISTLEKQLLPG